jgi:hypothetical protein
MNLNFRSSKTIMLDFKDFEDRENESENRSSPDSKKSVTYNEPLKNNSKSVTKFAIGNYSHLLKDPRQVKIKNKLSLPFFFVSMEPHFLYQAFKK